MPKADLRSVLVVRSLRRVGLIHLTSTELNASVTLCGKPCKGVWWGIGGRFDAATDCKRCASQVKEKIT